LGPDICKKIIISTVGRRCTVDSKEEENALWGRCAVVVIPEKNNNALCG
jgi:hypothetical protein